MRLRVVVVGGFRTKTQELSTTCPHQNYQPDEIENDPSPLFEDTLENPRLVSFSRTVDPLPTNMIGPRPHKERLKSFNETVLPTSTYETQKPKRSETSRNGDRLKQL